jgi:hypothetical protein
MASLSGDFTLQAFSDAGVLLASGRLYTYAYGLTTHKPAYTDAAGLVPHTYTSDGAGGQYIALNARGELPAPLYLAPGSYDIALKRPDGSTVWTRRADPVADGADAATAAATALRADLASSSTGKGAALVGFQTSVSDRTVQDKLAESASIFDFLTRAQIAAVKAGTSTEDLTSQVTVALNAVSNLYFPAGTYHFNVNLAGMRGKTITGAGRDITVFKNFGNFAVFKLDSTTADCKFNAFRGFRILNRDKAVYTAADGFFVTGIGTLENDFNEFESLEIVGMRHGFHFTSRAIWNSYTNVHVYSSILDGFHAVVTDNMSAQSFRQCRFGQNGRYGLYASKDTGDLLASWTFNQVTFEKNAGPGIYIGGTNSGINAWSFTGCYFEENTRTVSAGSTAPRKANIHIDALSCIGLTIDACSLFGTPEPVPLDWAIHISSTNSSGRIGPCRPGNFAQGLAYLPANFLVEAQVGGSSGVTNPAGGTITFSQLVAAVSDSFALTLTGCTTSPQGTAFATRHRNTVTLTLPAITGTSNSSAATLTGLPAAFVPARAQTLITRISNNSAVALGIAQISTAGLITLYSDAGGGAFASSGVKGQQAVTITYHLD